MMEIEGKGERKEEGDAVRCRRVLPSPRGLEILFDEAQWRTWELYFRQANWTDEEHVV